MFKDYYGILEVNENATDDEIKVAFRRLAIKWHPDKNPGIDTTLKMQELNEAYVVLKDREGRERYNHEYQHFKQFVKTTVEEQRGEKTGTEESNVSESQTSPFEFVDYIFNDEILRKWMANAEKQAVDLAKQTIEDLKGMALAGVKEGSKAILYQIGGVLIVLMLFAFVRTCNQSSSEGIAHVSSLSKTDIWFNNSIRWFQIKTPTKFVKQEIDYQRGMPGYSENINTIENYAFKSNNMGGTFLYMDTKFEAYIPETGLRKSIENLLHTTSSYNLNLSCGDVDNEFDDAECTGTFDTDEFKGFVRGYCIWLDKKVYSVAILTDYQPNNIALVDSIFKSVKIIK
jgi:hypothetical protein